MIKNIRHTGLVIRDMDNAVDFYEGLGFVLKIRNIEQGSYIEEIVGIDSVVLETAKFNSPCGGMLELLKYHSHTLHEPVTKHLSNKLGCSHIAISVESIERAIEYIEKKGGSRINDPVIPPNTSVKVAYCHDPEGILLELVEEF